MKRLCFLLVAIGIEGSIANGATLTFEGIAPPTGFVEAGSIVIDGYSFVSTRKLFVLSSSYFNVGTVRVANGSDYLFCDTFLTGTSYSLTISDNLGRPFTASSFDAVEANRDIPGGFKIMAEGNLVGGGTVSQTFITAPHPAGELGQFQGFAFSPQFTSLESLVLTASPATVFDELAIDNLQIASVPEPMPTQLLLVGIGSLLIILRCKCHSQSTKSPQRHPLSAHSREL